MTNFGTNSCCNPCNTCSYVTGNNNSGSGSGYGYGGFAFILVLFILLVICGAAFLF